MKKKDFRKYRTRILSNAIILIMLFSMIPFVGVLYFIGDIRGLIFGLFLALLASGLNILFMSFRARQYLYNFEILDDRSITFVYYLKDTRHERNIYFENLDFYFAPIKGDMKLVLFGMDKKLLTINYTTADHKKLFKKLNTVFAKNIEPERLKRHKVLHMNLFIEKTPFITLKKEVLFSKFRYYYKKG